jgi:HK97 family phage major capsid protein
MKDAMKAKREDLKKLLGELKTVQDRMGAGELTQPEAEAADTKVVEAEALQTEIKAYDDRMRRFSGLQDEGSKISDPVLPPDDSLEDGPETKADRRPLIQQKAADGRPVAAYMRLGHYVATQKALAGFVAQGMPKAQVVLASVPSLIARKGEPLVPVSREMLQAAYEAKAVPTLGTGVIEPARVPEAVRVTEHDRLQLRDVLDVQPTNSDAVKYTRILSYTRAAAPVANSAAKPQAAMALDAVTEAVRTIAVWMPVENQQLSDYPALAGLINNELLYDVDKHVEELVIYGDGTGENFSGIVPDPAVLDCRTEVGDTLIDIARRGVTDVRRAGYEPNAILVDPLDWEDIVLAKGTDNRYVWVVVTEGATQRLWGVPVIETVAMQDFAGVTTEERTLLVGDFRRGATLWDRESAQISVGWINDQFVKNQRTILAEMRAAFGVKRPGAFRKHQTQAPSSS